MALPQAQLGSMPNISLGGYIPAARQEENIWERALASFLSGAAGTVAGRAVDKVMPDPQVEARNKLLERQVKNQETQTANTHQINSGQLGLSERQFGELQRKNRVGELNDMEKTIYGRYLADKEFSEKQRVNDANISNARTQTANDTTRAENDTTRTGSQVAMANENIAASRYGPNRDFGDYKKGKSVGMGLGTLPPADGSSINPTKDALHALSTGNTIGSWLGKMFSSEGSGAEAEPFIMTEVPPSLGMPTEAPAKVQQAAPFSDSRVSPPAAGAPRDPAGLQAMQGLMGKIGQFLTPATPQPKDTFSIDSIDQAAPKLTSPMDDATMAHIRAMVVAPEPTRVRPTSTADMTDEELVQYMQEIYQNAQRPR